MDVGPEASHTNLIEVGLPSTIADMKNPTEEYILNLITQFLNKFHIDVNAIRRPTFDQLNVSLVQDNPEILGLVNLSQAIASICKKIFLNGFHLTDITSPVPKRSRKIAKLMVNFLLYATNKMVEIEGKLEETRIQRQYLQELRNERMALIEAKNAKALRIAKKLEHKKQLETEITKLRIRKEERKSRRDAAEEKLKAAEHKKMETAQSHRNLTAQAIKTRKTLEDIKSKIVTSPERYEALLHDVTEQKKQQNEKRAVIEEALKAKKPAIEQIESCLSFVRQEHAKFSEVTEACKRFAESKKEMEQVQKKIIEVKSIIEEESKVVTEDGTQVSNAALLAAKTQCDEHLSGIIKEHKELSTEKEVLEKKIEDSETRLQEILSKRDMIRASIIKKEAECKQYLMACKEIYDNEMKEEWDMRSGLENILEGNLKKKKK